MEELRRWLVAKGLESSADHDSVESSELLRRAMSIDRYLARTGLEQDTARELLAAILTGNTASQGTARSGAVSIPVSENRFLTTLYCEIDLSTPLAGWLDPDDFGDHLANCCSAIAQKVTLHGGIVGDVIGVGVLGYFGYPVAHEDDTARAIAAALAILDDVEKLREPSVVDFNLRIGVSVGTAIAGAVAGGTFTEHGAVVGTSPNLAVHLKSAAEPDSVVVSDQVRTLVGSRFIFADAGQHSFPDLPEPQRCWRVVRRHPVQSRFSAHQADRLSPLIGRRVELELLDACWDRVRRGDSAILQIIGEAGVGKSRLVNDAFDRVRTQDQERVRIVLQCSELQTNDVLHPIVSYVEYAAQFGAGDSVESRLDKLEAFFGPDYAGRETVIPLIAGMMSVPLGDRYPDPALTPQAFKQRLFDFMCGWLCDQAARRPVLVLFEDVHWSDATTRELIGALADAVRGMPVLVVLTSRMPIDDGIHATVPVETFELKRLDPAASRDLVVELTAGTPLSSDVVDRIVARTDGNPLFIEETVKFVVGQPANGEGIEADEALLPATLLETLQSRLDRLGQHKRLTQFVAALGRSFSHAVIEATWPFDKEALTLGLDRLLHDGLLEMRPAAETDEYRFAHGLIRDAAYGSLLKQDRVRFHRHIAERLEQAFPQMSERDPQLLAHHHAAAGNRVSAVEYLIRSANQALARSAYVEASNHIVEGLGFLPHIEHAATAARLAMELRIPYGAALVARHGYAVADVDENYRLLLETARAADSDFGQFHALLGLSRAAIVRADMRLATELTGDFLAVAGRIGRPELQLTAELLCGIAQLMSAKLKESDATLNRVIAAYDPEKHAGLAHRLGQDPGITAMFWSAQNAWLRGDSATATQLREQALTLARRLEHPFTLTYMLVRIAGLDRLRGDLDGMRTLSEEAVALADKHAFPAFAAGARFWLADAEAARSSDAEALVQMADEIAAHEPTDQRTNVSHLLACRAERAIELDRFDIAEQSLRQCKEEIAQTGVYWCEAESIRLRGRLAEKRGKADEACRLYTEAAEKAAEQGSAALELRAVLDFARNAAARDTATAAEALRKACAQFTGTADDAELTQAKNLLRKIDAA